MRTLGLVLYPAVPHTSYVDSGQIRAAEAAELRRAELGLTQAETGVTAKWWRAFVNGEQWPGVRTRARIEAHLNWQIGALNRIAAGDSIATEEALEYQPNQPLDTQEQIEAVVGRLMLDREAVRRRVVALRQALADEDFDTIMRLAKEIDEIFDGPESD